MSDSEQHNDSGGGVPPEEEAHLRPVIQDGCQGGAQPRCTDSWFAWLIVAMSFACSMGMAISLTALGLFLPDFLDYFQLPQATFGIMGSVRTVLADITSGQ